MAPIWSLIACRAKRRRRRAARNAEGFLGQWKRRGFEKGAGDVFGDTGSFSILNCPNVRFRPKADIATGALRNVRSDPRADRRPLLETLSVSEERRSVGPSHRCQEPALDRESKPDVC